MPPKPRETRLNVIAKSVQDAPPNATHWSRWMMAETVGISPSSVGRIWADTGLKPPLTKGFKVSNDPLLKEKVTDIVELCLDPPERAVVLCLDETSQIQALDRTQPGLPLKTGRAETMTHDDKRHGTTTSAAWLNLVERFFAEITARRIRRGSSSSVDDLEEAIYDDLLRRTAKPKPFVWSKTADNIIAREPRALNALDDPR